MSNVLNKKTLEYRESVNTTDYMNGQWLINPVLPRGSKRYWKIVGNRVVEMSSEEKKMKDITLEKEKLKKMEVSKRERLIQKRIRKIAIDSLIADGTLKRENRNVV